MEEEEEDCVSEWEWACKDGNERVACPPAPPSLAAIHTQVHLPVPELCVLILWYEPCILPQKFFQSVPCST